VLSSQKSETTNRSLKRRLCTIADLCDFYNVFCDVVFEWRSKENGEDHRCSKGKVEMVFLSIHLLNHATSLYTIEAFGLLEKEFIDGTGYRYKEVKSMSCNRKFKVWGVRTEMKVVEESWLNLNMLCLLIVREGT